MRRGAKIEIRFYNVKLDKRHRRFNKTVIDTSRQSLEKYIHDPNVMSFKLIRAGSEGVSSEKSVKSRKKPKRKLPVKPGKRIGRVGVTLKSGRKTFLYDLTAEELIEKMESGEIRELGEVSEDSFGQISHIKKAPKKRKTAYQKKWYD